MFMNLSGSQDNEREPLRIPVPFLHEQVGLGDLVKAATDAAGVRPCGGCKQRQEALNRRIVFNPWAT